jgi:uncharacterized membrane protein
MPAHEAIEKLPFDLQGLNAYDAILLSDIGANSLLLHPNDLILPKSDLHHRLSLFLESGLTFS